MKLTPYRVEFIDQYGQEKFDYMFAESEEHVKSHYRSNGFFLTKLDKWPDHSIQDKLAETRGKAKAWKLFACFLLMPIAVTVMYFAVRFAWSF